MMIQSAKDRMKDLTDEELESMVKEISQEIIDRQSILVDLLLEQAQRGKIGTVT